MLIIVNAVKLLVMCEVDVKGVREKLGYTQKEFAKLVFSSERTVQNWEAGKTIPPSKHEILRVLESKANGVESVGADALHLLIIDYGVSGDWLLAGKGKMFR